VTKFVSDFFSETLDSLINNTDNHNTSITVSTAH
jgi:hypothetical protein